MSHNSSKSSSDNSLSTHFWKLLAILGELNQDVSLDELILHLGTKFNEDDVKEAVQFLKAFHFPIDLTYDAGNWSVILLAQKPKISLELNLVEWMALQSYFPLLEAHKDQGPYDILSKKMKTIEKEHPDKDFFQQLKLINEKRLVSQYISTEQNSLLETLNRGMAGKSLLFLKFDDQKVKEIYPHRLVFLEGVLSLIGEETSDRCLECIEFHHIRSCKVLTDHTYRANYAGLEIDDFIGALRSVSGNEERLVLRVRGPENVNLNPDFHFLGNPYVTTNMDGEFIWAASVEISNELFSWLESIKDSIEILDPQEIKDQFEDYLFNKALEEKPLKKAS